MYNCHYNCRHNTLVITDHFGSRHKSDEGIKHDIHRLINGCNAAKEAANGRINIIFGVEINFSENKNDYLVYGLTEDFLLNNPDIYNLGIKEFVGCKDMRIVQDDFWVKC